MAHLVIKQDGRTEYFELTMAITSLGRAEDCEVQVMNTKASRKHCQIEECEKGYRLVDLDSANGTLINGEKINVKILEAGDTIEIGATVISFELERKDLLRIRREIRKRSNRTRLAGTSSKKKRKKQNTSTKVNDKEPYKSNEDTAQFDKRTLEQYVEKSANETQVPMSSAETKADIIISIRRLINQLLEQFKEEGALELENIFTEYWDPSVVGIIVQPLVEDRNLMEHLFEVSQALNSELNLDTLLDKILNETVEFTNAERCFLILFDKKGKPKVELARNIDKEPIANPNEKFSQLVVKTVKETGKPLLSTDAHGEERFDESTSIAEMRIRSLLCVPLKTKDEVIGVLYVDNRFETSVFSERDLLWLETIADQASISINNARLYEENAKKALELEKALSQLRESNLKVSELNELLKKKVKMQAEELEVTREKLMKHQDNLSEKSRYENIIGKSEEMQKVFSLIDKAKDSDASVIIQGESGTGKELVARALHFSSKRKNGPFVAENCAAIPENLFESIFFGHVKGSFTGADRDKPGLFELADGGSMFLDEIGDMPYEMQKKFLRVLQEGEIRRVGASKIKKINFRLIAATNKNLKELVEHKNFREDLFFRINIIAINIPPLRYRKADIPELADYFIGKFAEKNKIATRKLSSESLEMLQNYIFPGNIRELENAIEHALTMAGNAPTLELEHFSEDIRQETKELYKVDTQKTLKDAVKEVSERVEKKMIETVLAECRWKKIEAIERLGISRPTLDSKIVFYKLKPPPD
ncbi:MAG: sigma 54-interacting transcriptional regulator [Planctomycetes bacterium]|nr:sigma 54-interacting transcriptional regulator [Planctomycetota bacterium]